MIKSLKGFVMNIVKSLQESQYRKASRYTRGHRLDQYLKSKGCQDVSCVEHWIKEFDRQEAKHGWL